MKILIVWLFVATASVAVYWLLVRPVLRRWAVLAPFWGRVDASEASLWRRVVNVFDGLKTKLSAAFVALSGALLCLHDFILPYLAGIDWTPITAMLPQWAWPLILVAVGALFGYLRTISFGPPARG